MTYLPTIFLTGSGPLFIIREGKIQDEKRKKIRIRERVLILRYPNRTEIKEK